uniref:Secreted protein n=1 Tax=Meloidogyne incognita TaxID=6306 RepID=A0A914NY58_MELIC
MSTSMHSHVVDVLIQLLIVFKSLAKQVHARRPFISRRIAFVFSDFRLASNCRTTTANGNSSR